MSQLKSNPYIVGNPIRSRTMFFGREDDFQFVARKLGQGMGNQIVVFCGDRRSGKTSILFQILGGRLGDEFLPVLLDLQMLAGIRGEEDFFRALESAAWAVLGEPLPGITPGRHSLERFLDRAATLKPGRTVLFLLDEYELLEAKIQEGILGADVLLVFSSLLESRHRVSFLFTGSTNLEDRNPDLWKPLLGKSLYRKISYLSRSDAARLVTEPVAGAVRYTPGTVEAVYRLTGGHPFYTQVVCQNLIDLILEEDRGNPSEADLEKIVREIVANPLPQMIYTWSSLSVPSRLILSLLAGNLITGEAWGTSQELLKSVRKTGLILPFDHSRIPVILEEIYHGEFLEKNEQGAYRFRMDLFRRWIGREHSLWKVAGDEGLGFRRKKPGRYLLPVLLALGALLAWSVSVLLPSFVPPPLPEYVENVIFQSNRGPFTLIIDGLMSYRTDQSPLGETRQLVPVLAAGAHDLSASTPDGATVILKGEVINSQRTTVVFYFPPPTEPGRAGLAGEVSPPAPSFGTLVINSDPPGASVLLENDRKGQTPLTLLVEPGFHPLWLVMPGYYRAPLSVDVEPGEVIRRTVVLEAALTVLVFDLNDTGKVFLDGEYLADLPTMRKIPVTSGRRKLLIEAGGKRREVEVDLPPGGIFQVNEKLEARR